MKIINKLFKSQALCILSCLTLFISGCATLQRTPVPLDQAEQAQVQGIPDVRALGGIVTPLFQNDIIKSIKQDKKYKNDYVYDKQGRPSYSALALSGGGSHGAFGAGFVYGWGESGARPEFKLVSGISTGSLIAPFAFLGQEYDEKLKKVFTTTSTNKIAEFLGIFSIFTSESLASTEPLRNLLEQEVDEKMIDDVATEHDQGRRLYIGTTNMDSQRLVIWNMGLIAKSKHHNREKLFRDVMLASSSIPVAFPPIYIQVEANGEIYDEMHTDGGTLAQVIFYAGTLDLSGALRATGIDAKTWPVGNIYIIRNGKLSAEPRHIQRKLPEISERAVETMIKSAARNDLFRIYAFSEREKANFNYVDIPDEFELDAEEPFDPVAMKNLFQLGREMGKTQDSWVNQPPGLSQETDK